VQPYIRAGIPEEFYGFLEWEEEQGLNLDEVAPEGMPTEEQVRTDEERFRRYQEWKDKRGKELDRP